MPTDPPADAATTRPRGHRRSRAAPTGAASASGGTTAGGDPGATAGAGAAGVDGGPGGRSPERDQQLSRGQAERRQRIVGAALELGTEGGYEAVQMRDVAARGGVALGTIYRYFSSKDHLLAAALVEWVRELESRVGQRPPRGSTTADRMVDILRRATRAMEREPRLSAAVVTALSSSDPPVAACQREVAVVMGRIQGHAFDAEFDAGVRDQIVRTLGHVWFSSLVGWVNGWFGIGQAGDELASAAHLLLDQYG